MDLVGARLFHDLPHVVRSNASAGEDFDPAVCVFYEFLDESGSFGNGSLLAAC